MSYIYNNYNKRQYLTVVGDFDNFLYDTAIL